MNENVVVGIGAFSFGLVIGWITYRTLRHREGNASISDIASVIAAVGGGAIVSLFREAILFGLYAIGLGVGFFLYLIIAFILEGKDSVVKFMTVEEGKKKKEKSSG
jgi:hypothetical protein